MITTRGSKWQLEGRFYSLRASYAYLLDKQCTWSWFICHPHEGHKPWEDLGLSRSHQPHHQDHPKGIQNVCVLIRHHRTTLKQPAYNSVNICNNTTKQVLVLAPLDTQRPWWEVSYLLKVKHQKKRQKVSRGCSYLLCQRTSSCHSFFSCLTMKNNKNKSKNFKCTKFFLKKCNYLVEKQTHTHRVPKGCLDPQLFIVAGAGPQLQQEEHSLGLTCLQQVLNYFSHYCWPLGSELAETEIGSWTGFAHRHYNVGCSHCNWHLNHYANT